MGLFRRLLAPVLAAVVVFALVACPKRVEVNQPGPGGLPRGIVEEGTPSDVKDEGLPIYPGAVRRASRVYETQDPIEKVRDYYIKLLGIQPVSRDERRETFSFDTADFTVILLPMGSAGGTEINFAPPRKTQ